MCRELLFAILLIYPDVIVGFAFWMPRLIYLYIGNINFILKVIDDKFFS